MRTPLFAFCLLLLTACPDEDETDIDPGTDSGTETDSETETETETSGALDCLKHHGIIGLTTRWDYRWHDSGRTGGRFTVVTHFDADANTATTCTTEDWTVANGAGVFHSQRVTDYVCDEEFLYVIGDEVVYDGANQGQPYNGFSTYSFDKPWVVASNSPKPGDTWRVHKVGSLEDDKGSSEFDVQYMSGVMRGDIPVSGGFTGMEIQSLHQDQSTSSIYWQEGYGTLYNGTSWLNKHTP